MTHAANDNEGSPVDFEHVRDACVRAAVEAYEDAGIRGLCAEGRWDCAVDAMRALDAKAVSAEARGVS